MDTLERECFDRGYHIYAHIWEAAVGEVLDCRRKPGNANDQLGDKFTKVKFSDTEAVSELSKILTLPKISRCTVVQMNELHTHCNHHAPLHFAHHLPPFARVTFTSTDPVYDWGLLEDSVFKYVIVRE